MNENKIIHKIKSAVVQAAAKLVGYSVHSYDYNKQHFALTYKEALEWVACYDEFDFVIVRRFGTMVAIRGV